MQLPQQLLQRKLNSHKRDFGHIFILAGSARFTGAAVLASKACLRAGAGLITLGIPKSLNSAIIKIKPLEVMTLPLSETKESSLSVQAYGKIKEFLGNVDILVIGPGLSQNRSTQSLIRKVIFEIDRPMVIDADGINALCNHLSILKHLPNTKHRIPLILTPHPGEMARLLNKTKEEIQQKRKTIAWNFAKEYNVILVLKGYRTVVCSPKDIYINKTGNPGMATAGSGDVLTGMIAAFLGQGLSPFQAAKYAVYLHGLAGDLAAREKTQIGMIASDIIEKIPEAIKISS
jgi:NAD(P)H-hydrate epimerase